MGYIHGDDILTSYPASSRPVMHKHWEGEWTHETEGAQLVCVRNLFDKVVAKERYGTRAQNHKIPAPSSIAYSPCHSSSLDMVLEWQSGLAWGGSRGRGEGGG